MSVVNLSGFQPCDFRGVYGDGPDAEVSSHHAYLIGRAIARRLPFGESVLLSGDGRGSTGELLAALEAGLDRRAVNLGTGVPTPLAYLGKRIYRAYASALVTASHNPPRFNGIKIQIGPLPITPAEIADIREEVGRTRAGDRPPLVPPAKGASDSGGLQQVWRAYRDTISRVFDCAAGREIALDCMHGCYSGYAPEALRSMGYAVTAIRDGLSADFNGCTPNPAEDRNLGPLVDAVKAGRFSFGAALDGDGDRVRFVDETGCPVGNGTILALVTRHLIETGKNGGKRTVVYDQKTRLAVVGCLREAGAEPLIEKSGHTFIRTRVLQEDALLAGEKSGHFFWGGDVLYPVPAGDCGLFAIFAVDELLRRAGEPLSSLAATVPDSPFYTGDIRGLRCEGDRAALLAYIGERVDRDAYAVSTVDGVRIEARGVFAHLRASVTESHMLTAAFDAMEARSLRTVADLVLGLLPDDAGDVAEGIAARVEQLCH